MNREIKFRAKRVDNGAWETGSLVKTRMYCSDETVFIADKMCGHHILVAPETVGQFIGRQDSDGKNIYEGDVISVNGSTKKIIKFIDRETAFCMANTSDLKHESWLYVWQNPSTCWWDDFKREIKVIGNIHDNYELLKTE